MIVTVTANAAIDRTVRVPALRRGARQTVLEDRAQAGGKGLNVARVLRKLGHAVRAIVVVGGEAGDWILRDLEKDGILATPIWAAGESRTCLEILEQERSTPTRLHGRGVTADATTQASLEAALEGLLGPASWVALCGRLAGGLPDDTYARLVTQARARGVRVALDTSAPGLAPAWAAGPDLLRINRDEATEALVAWNRERLPPDRTPGCSRLAVVSDGASPAVAWTAEGICWRIVPPKVEAINPIGCGDAMLAGLLDGLGPGDVSGWNVEAALRCATALAAAEAEAPTAGLADPERARALEPQVVLHAGS